MSDNHHFLFLFTDNSKAIITYNDREYRYALSVKNRMLPFIIDVNSDEYKQLTTADEKVKYLWSGKVPEWGEFIESIPVHIVRIFKVMLKAMYQGELPKLLSIIINDDFLLFQHHPITRTGELRYRSISDEELKQYVLDENNLYNIYNNLELEGDSEESDSSDGCTTSESSDYEIDQLTEGVITLLRNDYSSGEEGYAPNDEELQEMFN